MAEALDVLRCEEGIRLGELAPVDSIVRYPSYRSFDEFIDLPRLRSLNDLIRERIASRVSASDDPKFYTGPHTLDEAMAGRPGSRMIYLARSTRPDSYFDLDRVDVWQLTDESREFAELMDFIGTLPFKATGRMLIMYDDVPREIPAHRDHTDTMVLHEFIWFRTNLDKPFYMLNCETGEKKVVEGYSAWFDTVNQFHGSEVTNTLAYSIRVDGVFSDEFRARIPRPENNPASTPSYWACLNEQAEG